MTIDDRTSGPLLEVDGLSTLYPVRSRFLKRTIGHVHAVEGVDVVVEEGETLAVVGESGCGKTTLARTIMGLVPATSGRVRFDGRDVTRAKGQVLRDQRRQMQMVYQDPLGSLDPRQRVRDILGEPLITYGGMDRDQRSEQVQELLELVGLQASHAGRFPHEFSGGQRQRIGIARALALRPKLLVLDEPVSALDVSIQAQILNLLQDLQEELGLSYLLISHDLAVVRHIADRLAVMYLGRIVESGPTAAIFDQPDHPYTQALLSAVPNPDPAKRNRKKIVLLGEIPSPINPPPGCRFHTRCQIAQAICAEVEPHLTMLDDTDRRSACHFSLAQASGPP